MAKLQYGSTEQTSTDIAGSTRDDSNLAARSSRRSLEDELDQVYNGTEHKEIHYVNYSVSAEQKVDGTRTPEETIDNVIINHSMVSSSSRTDDVENCHVIFASEVTSPQRRNDRSCYDSIPPSQNERETEQVHTDQIHHNTTDNDDSHLEDSLSRIRSLTNTSSYQTHSEAEECNESDFIITLSTDTVTFGRRSRAGSLFSSLLTPRSRRRRRISRPGALVTDSYADECVCCCSIL